MKHCFLAVDDEVLALADLTNALEEAAPGETICPYNSPSAALEAVRKKAIRPDVAFLDIQMRGWTGLQLATELRKVLPGDRLCHCLPTVRSGVLLPPRQGLSDEARHR